jgi:hypothetical protein
MLPTSASSSRSFPREFAPSQLKSCPTTGSASCLFVLLFQHVPDSRVFSRFFSTLFMHELLLLGATTVTSTEMDPTVRQLVRDHKKLQGLHSRITRRSNNGYTASSNRRSPEPRATVSRKQCVAVSFAFGALLVKSISCCFIRPTKITRSPGPHQDSSMQKSPQYQYGGGKPDIDKVPSGPRPVKRHVTPIALASGSVIATPAFQIPSLAIGTVNESGTGGASRAAMMATKPSPSAWAVPFIPKPTSAAAPLGQPPSLLSSATMLLPSPPPPLSHLLRSPAPEEKPLAQHPQADEPDIGVVSWLCDARFPGVQKFFFAFLRVADCQSLNALLLRKLTAVVVQVSVRGVFFFANFQVFVFDG